MSNSVVASRSFSRRFKRSGMVVSFLWLPENQFPSSFLFLISLNCLWCTKLMLEFLVKLLDKTCSFTSTPPPNRFVWKAESQRCGGWGRDQVGGESAGAPVCRPTPQMAGWPRLSEAATRSLELPHLSCAIAFPCAITASCSDQLRWHHRVRLGICLLISW